MTIEHIKFQRASPKDVTKGWTLDPKLLWAVKNMVNTTDGWELSEEEIESVVLSLAKFGYTELEDLNEYN